MLKLKITVHRNSLYYKLPIYSRIPYVILLSILLWGIIKDFQNVNFIIVFLFIISYVGLFYTESWCFDNSKKKIFSKFGVFPFVKTKEYEYSSIEKLDITHFYKGETVAFNGIPKERNSRQEKRRQRKAMLVFSMFHIDGSEPTKIEIIEEHTSSGRTENAAVRISSFTGIGLNQDRETTEGPDLKMKNLQKNMFDFH